MNNAPRDEAFEVSDSTDWLETPLRSLAPVDSALRCQVCKDFYNTPMITSCSHTFCSICIRRCLSNDGRCPACRTQDQELKLRFNGAMEELVEAFKAARPEVLEHARKPEVVVVNIPKRSRETDLEDEESPPKKRTRSSGRTTQQKQRVVVLDSDGEDEDYIPEEGYVLCPICEKEMKLETINAHIDRGCQDEPRTTKPAIGRDTKNPKSAAGLLEKPIKRPERLAQLHYGGLKDTALRKKLTDLSLSAAGSRQLLEKRYTEWVTLWNANCDATRPKSKGELKRELDIWERTQGGMTQASSSTQNPGAQIKNKDFDATAWSSKHDDSFRDLIAAARKKVAVKPQTPESASNTADPSDAPTPMVGAVAALPNVPPVDMEMTEIADAQTSLERVENSPVKKDASERRFFLENDTPQSAPHNSAVPSPSQYPTNISKLDRGMGSDMTTIIQSSQ